MNSKLLLSGAAAAAAMTIAVSTWAQAPAPTPTPPAPPAPPPASKATQPPAATLYTNQLPETRGTVQRFVLTPIGELEGVILADGTQVHLPPHLTTQLAGAVRTGDTVTVQGYRSSYVPLVVAASITDTNTGQTVVDTGPPPPGSRPPPPPPGVPPAGAQQQMTVQGKVQQALYGPGGDVNGALLDDGTIVRIGPREAYLAAALLNPGQTLAAQGWGLTTSYGRVVEAQALGPSPGQMTQVAPLPPGFAYPPAAAPPPPPAPR